MKAPGRCLLLTAMTILAVAPPEAWAHITIAPAQSIARATEPNGARGTAVTKLSPRAAQ